MPINYSNVATSDNFDTWLFRTNQLLTALRVQVVTADSNAVVGNVGITGTATITSVAANTVTSNVLTVTTGTVSNLTSTNANVNSLTANVATITNETITETLTGNTATFSNTITALSATFTANLTSNTAKFTNVATTNQTANSIVTNIMQWTNATATRLTSNTVNANTVTANIVAAVNVTSTGTFNGNNVNANVVAANTVNAPTGNIVALSANTVAAVNTVTAGTSVSAPSGIFSANVTSNVGTFTNVATTNMNATAIVTNTLQWTNATATRLTSNTINANTATANIFNGVNVTSTGTFTGNNAAIANAVITKLEVTGEFAISGGYEVANVIATTGNQIRVEGATPHVYFVATGAGSPDYWLSANGNSFFLFADRDSNGTNDTPIPFESNVTAATTYSYGQKIWTAGNDGAGSTLDADLLDGNQGSYYQDLANSTGTLPNARVSGAYDGITTLGTTGRVTITTGTEALRLEAGSATSDPYLTFFKLDVRQGYIQHQDGTAAGVGYKMYNDLSGQGILIKNTSDLGGFKFIQGSSEYEVWHAGNDGASSGLDSDLLDGQHGSYYTSVANLSGASGMICWFARNSAPTGFLKANGAAVSRTTYAALYAAIGTTFGAGDGTTTFNVPDLRGEFIRGWDDGRGVDTGRVFGSAQTDEFQSHTHSVDPPSTTTTSDTHTHTWSGTTSSDAHTHTFSATTNTTGAHTHNTRFFTGTTSGGDNAPGGAENSANGTEATTSAGDHSHTVSGTTSSDSHTHTVSGTTSGDTHSHTVDIASFTSGATGSTETRPRNIALLACIKY